MSLVFSLLSNLPFHLHRSRASPVRRQVISCAVGAVACSGCAVLSPVGPSALSSSHVSCLAGVLGVAESLAPVALQDSVLLLVLLSLQERVPMKRRLLLIAASISSFFSKVTLTFGMPRPEVLLMNLMTFTFRPCFSRMAVSISSSPIVGSTSFTTTLRASSILASVELLGGQKTAEVPMRPLSSLFMDS